MPDRKQNAKSAGAADKGPGFDEALTQLEGIVRKLESGELKLEDALTAFEEGTRLSRLCEAQLTQAETRIRELVEGEDGWPNGRPVERAAELPEGEPMGSSSKGAPE